MRTISLSIALLLGIEVAGSCAASDPWRLQGRQRSAFDAPVIAAGGEDVLQQRRARFVDLVKSAQLERFDDARQEVTFKRIEAEEGAHEPGPLEDEAIASGVRHALAASYSKWHLRPHVSCTAGKLKVGELPDDPVDAAATIELIVSLDGVRTITAALPLTLRQG